MTTKVFICTPAFDGKVHVQYAIALSETVLFLAMNQIQTEFKISISGSLLCAERNRLTEAFMNSDCTHMMCIDSDLGWPYDAVKKLIDKDEEFISGVYPSRRDNQFMFRPAYNQDNSIVKSEKNLLKMEFVPAGFMLIKRSAILKMRRYFPELYFEPKDPSSAASKGYCFFHTELRDGEFWGEDYTFCRMAREAGVDIWCDPMITFDHAGVKGALIEALTDDPEKALKRNVI
jgi:hypothetical protein